MEVYTLTREELQAVAARAAEIAIEMYLGGTVPKVRPPSLRMEPDGDTPQLTDYERRTVAAIFQN